MDFIYSIIDIIITLCIPGKLEVIEKERKLRGSLLGDFHLEDPTDDLLELRKRKIIKEAKHKDFD